MHINICECKGKCTCTTKPRQMILKKSYIKLSQKKRKQHKKNNNSIPPNNLQCLPGPTSTSFDLPTGTSFDLPTSFDVQDLNIQDKALCYRLFTFDHLMNPTMFSRFDGYVINNKLYLFNSPISREQLNNHLLLKHHLFVQEDGFSYLCHFPTTIETFSLKPLGYLDPTSYPENTINTMVSEKSFSLLTLQDDWDGNKSIQILDCRELLTGMMKGVSEPINYYGSEINPNNIKIALTKEGSQYFNKLTKQIFNFDGSRWIEFQGASCQGTVELNSLGEAKPKLPLWISQFVEQADNFTFWYSLTPIGHKLPDLYLKEEVHHQIDRYQITISGGIPGYKLCWEVKIVNNI